MFSFIAHSTAYQLSALTRFFYLFLFNQLLLLASPTRFSYPLLPEMQTSWLKCIRHNLRGTVYETLSTRHYLAVQLDSNGPRIGNRLADA